jgi:hypothetical protein
MTTPLPELIEKAATKAGGYRALSHDIGVPDSHLHNYRSGARKCPIDIQVLIAAAAGLDADEALRHAIVEQHAGTKRGVRLAELLGIELSEQEKHGHSCIPAPSRLTLLGRMLVDRYRRRRRNAGDQ